MGRKIPPKKHKGVKNPLLQLAQREEKLKNVVNAPPKVIDYQELPKKVEQLMKLRQMTKDGVFNKIKKKNKKKDSLITTTKFLNKEKLYPGMSEPDRNIPVFSQTSTESDDCFIRRVNRTTHNFVKEVNFEVKNNITLKKDEKTGQLVFDKINMHPVDKMFHEKALASKVVKKKRKRKPLDEEGLSKTAKRKLRQQERKNILNDSHDNPKPSKGKDDGERIYDKVAFNEVVHMPPKLTAFPRSAGATDETRRPGNKPGLLLAQMLENEEGSKRDLTVRRRDLSMSDRRQMDQAQATAIKAYRQIKASRAKINSLM